MRYPKLTFRGAEAISGINTPQRCKVWLAARKQNPEKSPSRTCLIRLLQVYGLLGDGESVY
jgi:hypothetical protein